MPTSKRLLRSLALTAAALGALTLTACGTQNAGAARGAAEPAAAAAVTASPSPRMLSGKELERHPDPVVRAEALAVRLANTCAPGTAMELPPLPEVANVAETVPGTPPAAEPPTPAEPPASAGVPADLPPDLPPPGPEAPVSLDEVPLTDVDRCVADAHADRIRAAFATAPDGEAALRKTLTGLDYLPETVHRMPGDALTVRIDLRELSPGDSLALEVTATGTGVRVDAFGAPTADTPEITQIRREQDA
ncbi:hypothetical protein ACI2LJ_10905 [Streptomyces sp. NPDC088090]|uniref:hypothetical protein n=1 Tax=Streptomyces sp. NPDC088090 TaxID=3365822 RepID=UPI00384D1722